MKRISVSLSDPAHDRLVARAAHDRRPPATLAALILEADLMAGQPPLDAEPGLEHEEPTGTGSASSGGEEAPAPPAARKKKRTAMCEHRIPPEQFCKRCDGDG